ncbi:MAG TPA: ribonuclease HI family protein [bacterium]|jgi:ribonuclease HI|nr:ribonuclease HI family protein [bacterium]HQI03596.1 ribonuclease HI family protein [bacterium]
MYKLFTDGGSRGNPGPSAIGGVIYDGDKIIKQFSERIPETTNNQAEYRAIIRGLELAKKLNIKELNCYLDSELVTKQINREFKVKDKDLAVLFVKLWNIKQDFKKITFTHIFREQNYLADKLVNQALDSN